MKRLTRQNTKIDVKLIKCIYVYIVSAKSIRTEKIFFKKLYF